MLDDGSVLRDLLPGRQLQTASTFCVLLSSRAACFPVLTTPQCAGDLCWRMALSCAVCCQIKQLQSADIPKALSLPGWT